MSDAREAAPGAPVEGDPAGERRTDDESTVTDAGAAAADTPGGDTVASERGDTDVADGGTRVQSLEQEGEIAADYVEGLLDVIDYDGDIDMDVEGERAVVSVLGTSGKELVGRRGEALEALQELTRLAVQQKTGVRSRLMLDIGGYRARRRAELTELGRDAAEQVRRSGEEKSLEPMTPFERKIIHDAAAAAGLRSESEGEEPDRYVVIVPL